MPHLNLLNALPGIRDRNDFNCYVAVSAALGSEAAGAEQHSE